MALAETAKLAIDLSLTGNAAAGLRGVEQRLTGLNAKVGRMSGGFKTLGAGIGVAFVNGAKLAAVAIGGLSALMVRSVADGQEVLRIDKLFKNALTSSGKITREQTAGLIQQQQALLQLTGTDDELVTQLQTRLIQMQATGKQTLALTPLIIAAATATGKAPEVVSMAVGKALQGSLGSLTRIGIVVPALDAAQKKAITSSKTLTAEQKRAALSGLAYNAILGEMTKRFGKVNDALSGTLEVRLKVLRENIANIREEIGIKLLPSLTRIVDVAGKDLVPAFGKFIDRIMPSLVSGIEQFASLLENGGAERGIKAITGALGPMVDLLKLAAAPVKAIVSAFLSLPSQVQGVLIGAFAVNKLSGGLIAKGVGEIAGGLLQRGGTPANPLFVMDVGKGAGGLAAGAAGGGLGLASKVFLVGEAIGLGVIVNEVRQNMADQNTAQSQTIQSNLSAFLAKSPSRADLQTALAGVEKGIHDIESNPLNVLVQGEALDNLKAMRDQLGGALSKGGPGLFGIGAAIAGVVSAIGHPGSAAEARSAGMRGIVERAARAGFKPTQAAVTATYERNVKRAAEAQQRAADKTKLAGDRLISAALVLTRAGERLSASGGTTIVYPGKDDPATYPGKPKPTLLPFRHGAGRGPLLAGGAYDVPTTMTATIEKGEMVVPRNFADFLRRRMALTRLRRLHNTSHPLPGLPKGYVPPWRNDDVPWIDKPAFRPSARLDPSQIIDRRPVVAVVSTRDVKSAQIVKRRAGPTAAEAGAM